MGQTPGGLCTSWRRKGYLFDGSVAGLAGTSPEAPIHRLWRDIGVVDYCRLYDPDDFGTVVAPDGRVVTVYTDIDRLEAHLLENFPARRRDHPRVRAGAARLRRAWTSRSGPRTGLAGFVAGARTGAASLRSLPAMLKYGRLTLRQFNARLQDPFCRQVFDNLVHFGGPDVPLLTVLLPHRLRAPPHDGHPARRLARFRARGRAALSRARRRRSATAPRSSASRPAAAPSVACGSPAARSSPRTACSRPPTDGSRAPSCSERRTVRASTRAACRTSPSR